MDLVKLDRKIPINAIPEEELNMIILTKLTVWLSDLLSLTDEVSAKRLETALPAVKKHCWSMGFDEVQKMFKMYADGELSVKPIANYFDRILVGKIFNAYRDFKKVQPEVKSSSEKEKEAKDNQDFLYMVQAFDFFKQYRELPIVSYWIYDYLETKKGLINYSNKEKKAKYRVCLKSSGGNETLAIEQSKAKLVEDYFARLEAKGQHIKELI